MMMKTAQGKSRVGFENGKACIGVIGGKCYLGSFTANGPPGQLLTATIHVSHYNRLTGDKMRAIRALAKVIKCRLFVGLL
jgi:hypothetical protein